MMARCGSMTRKYTTAFTFTDTLSREITSCGGTSNTTVRSSTFTICCTTGKITTSPGPFTFQKRPSMNTTPRSYSRRMRNDERNSIAMTTTIKPLDMNPLMSLLRRRFDKRFDVQDQSFASHDLDAI